MNDHPYYYEHAHNQVGRRIMEIRIIRGLSRQDIIERSMVPITMDVLEKTEMREYCLDAHQLSELGRLLDVPILRFFQPWTEIGEL